MVEADYKLFRKNIRNVYDLWQKDSETSGNAAIVFFVNEDNSTGPMKRGTALQHWLFDYEFANAIFVLTQSQILILTSQTKVNFLSPLVNNENFSPEVVLLTRNKTDDSENYNKLIEAISASGDGSTIGVFMADKPTCKFTQDFDQQISMKFTKVAFDAQCAAAMLPKSDEDISNIKIAAKINYDLYKTAKQLLYTTIEEGKKLRNCDVAHELSEYIAGPKFEEKFLDFVNHAEVCHEPFIASGGRNMNLLEEEMTSTRKPLILNTIVISLAQKYKSLVSTLARTILINPSPAKEQNYDFTLQLFSHITNNLLKIGAKLNGISEQAMQFVQEKRPDLAGHLMTSFGYASGIMFNDKKAQIASTCDLEIAGQSCFVVQIGFLNLRDEESDKKSMKDYSIFIADTVWVKPDGNELLTTSKKDIQFVKMVLSNPDGEDADDSSEEEEDIDQAVKDMGYEELYKNPDRKRKRGNFNDVLNTEREQQELRVKLYDRANEKLAQMTPQNEAKDKIALINCYSNTSELPQNKDTKAGKIYVDKEKQAILFPINGEVYPVHISKVKNLNLTNTVDGKHVILRVNLLTPMSMFKATEEQMSCFVKELHFKANDFKSPNEIALPSTHLRTILTEIKDLQKAAKKPVNAGEANLIKAPTEKMVPFSDGKRVLLHNVFFRPLSANKRMGGTLEAFQNGFVYTKKSGERHSIPYSAVKHAIYVPCNDDTLIIAIHLRFNGLFELGTKKVEDVQFYAEAGELSESVDEPISKRRRVDDDYHDEEIRNQLMKRLRATFITFCKDVEQKTKGLINFDRPSGDKTMMASPIRNAVSIMLSEKLMFSLIEWPAFILDATEVELAYIERDIETLQTCDIAIIFRDYTKKVLVIRSIMRNDLNAFKRWLTDNGIAIFAGVQALSWPKIMSTILDDPQGFSENGNWKFLSLDASDNESGQEDEDNSSSESEDDEDDEDDEDESSSYEEDDEESDESMDDEDDDDDEDESDYDDSD